MDTTTNQSPAIVSPQSVSNSVISVVPKQISNGDKAKLGYTFHYIVESFVRTDPNIIRVVRGKGITYKGQSKRMDMTYQIVNCPFVIDDDAISSCRDDRIDAKQHKADIIKRWRRQKGQVNLQFLTMPDDFHFDGVARKDKEIEAVNRAIYSINHNLGSNYIDFAVKINDKAEVVKMISENSHMSKGHLKRKIQNHLNKLYDDQPR